MIFFFPFVLAFVAKLVLREEVLLENVDTSPKSERENPSSSFHGGSFDVDVGQEFCANDVYNRGMYMIENV